MKYIEPNLPDHVFKPQILQPLCLVCRKFEDSGGHIMSDQKAPAEDICSHTGRKWSECECGMCERGLSTRQKAPAEIEAALDRYADFATDTNRNRVMDSINDLRTRLAESKIKTRTTQAKLENMATECGQAEGLLRRCREDLAEAQAKNTEDKETLMWAIRAKDKQLQQWQDDYQELTEKQSTLEAEAVELRKDRARLDAIDDNGWEIFRSGNAESHSPIFVVRKFGGARHSGPTLRMALNRAMGAQEREGAK